MRRGLIDRKGEPFGYLLGNELFTLDGEKSGRLQDGYIVDLAGRRVWRVVGDGIYAIDDLETIGYISSPAPPDY